MLNKKIMLINEDRLLRCDRIWLYFYINNLNNSGEGEQVK